MSWDPSRSVTSYVARPHRSNIQHAMPVTKQNLAFLANDFVSGFPTRQTRVCKKVIRATERPTSDKIVKSPIRYPLQMIQKSLLFDKYDDALHADVVYELTVRTGNCADDGTTANVYIQLTGQRGTLPKVQLDNSDKTNFSAGSICTFSIPGANVGEPLSLLIETDAFDDTDNWYLLDVVLVNTASHEAWIFTCNNWLSLWRGDGRVARSLQAKPYNAAEFIVNNTEYEIILMTGDKRIAGTSANVFVKLFGKNLATPRIHLACDDRDCFRRAKKDVFLVTAPYVGPITRIRVEHDNSGSGPSWFLDKVLVTDLLRPQARYYFPCQMWLALDEGDGRIMRDLTVSLDPLQDRIGLIDLRPTVVKLFAVICCEQTYGPPGYIPWLEKICIESILSVHAPVASYKVDVYTGNMRVAGTDANVFITVFGDLGDSGEHCLDNSENNFDQGSIDEFVLHLADLGALRRIKVRHDNSGFDPSWFLEMITVEDMTHRQTYEFPCHRWLADNKDDGKIERDLVVRTSSLEPGFAGVQYTITIVTGDVPNAGTSACVYTELHGGQSGRESSGKLWLKGGKFHRKRDDVFNVEVAAMLSPLSFITIGHDNSGIAPGWFVDKVIILCLETGIEQTFLCNQWLARGEGDGLITRDLFETKGLRKERRRVIPWLVSVYTGDKFGAGTDTDVFLILYGQRGKSDHVRLRNKCDNFERGQIDKFKVAILDVGTPTKLRLSHNNMGNFTGWFVDKVELLNILTNQQFYFPCGRWLSRNEDDGQVIRELPAIGPNITSPLPVVKYRIQVFTGSQLRADTEANVFVCIFGDYGDTGERPLLKSLTNTNKFERAMMDEFLLEAVSLGRLQQLTVRTDGSGPGSSWFLEKIIVISDCNADQVVVFPCNRWLATDEDDGQLERTLFPHTVDLVTDT